MNFLIFISIGAIIRFGYILAKPITDSTKFDISIGQSSFNTKIDDYFSEKWNSIKQTNECKILLTETVQHDIKNVIDTTVLDTLFRRIQFSVNSFIEIKVIKPLTNTNEVDICDEFSNNGINKHVKEYGFKKYYKYNIKSTRINEQGYRCLIKNNWPIHRLIMSNHLGRRLTKEEVVHHIDGNKLNNKFSNLMLFSRQTEHDEFHRNNLKTYGSWHARIPKYTLCYN